MYDHYKSFQALFPEIFHPPPEGVKISKKQLENFVVSGKKPEDYFTKLRDAITHKDIRKLKQLLMTILGEIIPPNSKAIDYDGFLWAFFTKVRKNIYYGIGCIQKDLDRLISAVREYQAKAYSFGPYLIMNEHRVFTVDLTGEEPPFWSGLYHRKLSSLESEKQLNYYKENFPENHSFKKSFYYEALSEGTPIFQQGSIFSFDRKSSNLSIPILKAVDLIEPIREVLKERIYEECGIEEDWVFYGDSGEEEGEGEWGLVIACPQCGEGTILENKKCMHCGYLIN